MVKKIIDGKAYNTETATLLATVTLLGYKVDNKGATLIGLKPYHKAGKSTLYQTMGGAYFLVRDEFEGASAVSEHVGPVRRGRVPVVHFPGFHPLSREKAMYWAQFHQLDTDEVDRIFGGVEEAGTEVGAMILRIPESLKKRIHAAAAESNQSVNSWAMRLFETTLGQNAKGPK